MAAGPPLHQSELRPKCDAPRPNSFSIRSWATLNVTMPSLTTKAYDCQDCGRRYDVPLRFFETSRVLATAAVRVAEAATAGGTVACSPIFATRT